MRNIKANLVVIGGGGAGMAAAVTAMDKGVTGIIVLDSRPFVGGNASMAGGFVFAVESPLQKEAGVDTSRDDVFKEVMAYHHYDRVDPRVVRAFIDKSGESIQWLVDNGAPMEFGPMGHKLKNIDRPIGNYSLVIRLLAEKLRAGGNQILVRTAAGKILRGRDGRVTAVVATTSDGEDVQINTKSAILSTGGFTGNRQLLKKYFPFYYDEVYVTDALPLPGDGIQLAAEAGAALEDYCTLIRETGYSFKTDVKGGVKGGANRAALQPSTIWVNKRGRRFVDETPVFDNSRTNALLSQPGKIGYALYDDQLMQNIIDQPDPFAGPDTQEEKALTLREKIIEEAKKRVWSMVAERWQDIAVWIGVDPAVLEATVEEYNSFCDRGHDDLFAKDKEFLLPLRKPPYYALKFVPLMIDTVGPVRVNGRMEVLDKQDKPIPGLYAGGVITSGWQGCDYHLFGSALGYSITSGRIAAESAAGYLR